MPLCRRLHALPALGCSWLLVFAGSPPCAPVARAANAASGATNGYEFRAVHQPDGIGKFYQGREIAHVMGHEAAEWLERPEREREEHSDELVPLLGLRPGQVAADIGAGTGYYTRRLAQAVGPFGKVYGEDIQPEMLEQLRRQMSGLGLTNVIPVLGTVADPRLPAESVDLVLMVDVYHELEFPFEMLQAVCRTLKPGGRVVFVEFRAEDPGVPIKPLHKMSEAQVKKEMASQPLEWAQTIEKLPWQHVLVFRKPAAAAKTKRADSPKTIGP